VVPAGLEPAAEVVQTSSDGHTRLCRARGGWYRIEQVSVSRFCQVGTRTQSRNAAERLFVHYAERRP
jgi:hypothetical protein